MNSLYLKRILGHLWSLALAQRCRRIVLLYHSVGSGPNSIAPQLFQSQMAWLAEHADVLPLDDFLAGAGSKQIRVSIGFDDGYASVADHAEPILRDLNLPATVYINTGWIGDSVRLTSDSFLGHYPGEQFMSWKDVQGLVHRGWTIGSHGVEHIDLTTVEASTLTAELGASKLTIEDRLNVTCHHFAYTWGRFNKTVQSEVANAGYRTAASALHGPVSSKSELFALPRIDIQKTYSMDDFKSIITGHWDFLGKIQQLRRLTKRSLCR